MKVIAFITEVAVVDRIIDHLKLTFVAAKPPPCSPHGFHEGRHPMFSSRLPCRRSRRQLRHQHLQRVVLRPELLDLIRARLPNGIAVELSLAGASRNALLHL